MGFRYLLVFAVFFFSLTFSYAQVKDAVNHYKAQEYAQAIPLYKKVVKHASKSAYLFDLADCYFHLKDYKNAELFFERYIRESERDTIEVLSYDTVMVESADGKTFNSRIDTKKTIEYHPKKTIAYLWYGEAIMSNNNYDKAKEQFKIYQRINPSDGRGKLFAKACDDVKIWTSLPNRFNVYPITTVNSKFSDFAAVDFKSGMVFISDRKEDLINETYSGYTHTPYLGMMYVRHKNMSDSLAYGSAYSFLEKYKGDYHTGPVCFSKNFDELYMSRVDEFKGKISNNQLHRPKLYHAVMKGNSWSGFEPFAYNNDAYSVSHPSLSEDGQLLFFSSDMPGGQGGSDIWFCKMEGTVWGKPVNAGPEVNTNGNESFPFIANNGTLYFASDAHEGIGGMDIFSSAFISGSFTEPINLKGAINSQADDFGIFFKPDNQTGYFASNRSGGKGADDIYGFRINPNVVNITGKILLTDNTGDGAESVKIMLLTNEGTVLQTTTTDKSGFFKFENILSDQYYIVKVDDEDPVLKKQKKLFMADENNRIVKVTVVSKDGYFVFENLPPDLKQLDQLELVDEALRYLIVEGTVVPGSDTTKPMSNIRIQLLTDKKELMQSRITDDKGHFVFNNINPSQKYILSVDETDPALKKEQKIFIKDKSGKTILTIDKSAQGAFSYNLLTSDETTLALVNDEDVSLNKNFIGKLMNAEDNSPIPFVQVNLMNKKKELLQTVKTDVFGNFKFLNIVGNQDLDINTDPADPTLSKYNKIKITDTKGHVLFYAERKKDGFSFQLLQSDQTILSLVEETDNSTVNHTLTGKMVAGDDTDRAIANAKVNVLDKDGKIIGTTTTDANGNFVFKNLDPDKEYIFAIDETDPAITSLNRVVLKNKAGKEIYASKKDEKGAFKFEILSSDYAGLSVEDAQDLSLRYTLTGVMLAGDGDNQPIANANVNVYNEQGALVGKTTTDSGGKFKFLNLKADEKYTLGMDADDPSLKKYNNIILTDKNGKILVTSRKDAKAGFEFKLLSADNNTLSLLEEQDVAQLSKELKGFLFDETSNAPIANAKIKLIDKKTNTEKSSSQTEKDGRFVFKNLLSTEDYLISLDVSDPALTKFTTVVIKDSEGKIILKSTRDERYGFQFAVLSSDATLLSIIEEEDTRLKMNITGRLLAEDIKALPISNASVILLDNSGNRIQTTITDNDGNFTFRKLYADENYLVTVDENDKEIKKHRAIILADAKGRIIKRIVSDKDGFFKFEILQTEQYRLGTTGEEDVYLAIKMNKSSKGKSSAGLSASEIFDRIYYEYAMCSLNESSVRKVDKLVKLMKEDKLMSIEINGYADSRGKAEYNYVLSRMRRDVVVNYMVSKGINKNRIQGKAYGETNLANGCMDGTQCTEEQHAENRRADMMVPAVVPQQKGSGY